jgi:glycosyltransferase involved in cell wall biosynthesis
MEPMRIAYIAPYQGPGLLQSRPIVNNLSLAGTQKIEVIAKLLHGMSHDVEIISQGEVNDAHWALYSSFQEKQPFHPDIPVIYSSSLPIRYLNGTWASHHTLKKFQSRHRERPFDVAIIYNLKKAQIACATYAIHRLGLPVILEYEDDFFVNVGGTLESGGLRANRRFSGYRKIFAGISGCIAASPFLLSRLPSHLPGLVLQGVVADDILCINGKDVTDRRNRVLFSGTHTNSKGIRQLITAWKTGRFVDWELHITGYGELTDTLRDMARETPNIVFHGLVDRQELVRLLGDTKICINPHDLSRTPGNVFAFKIIEYLAAGAHVITTPMGTIDKDLERGITYIQDNHTDTIAATLEYVIRERKWGQIATRHACNTYGSDAVSRKLDTLLRQALSS